MDVCQSSKEKAAAALKKLEHEKDVLDSKKSEQRELDIREQVCVWLFGVSNEDSHNIVKQLQRQLQNSTEKLNRLSQHQQSKHSLNQSKLDVLKKEYEGVTESRSVAQKKADDHEKMSLEIEKKVRSLHLIMRVRLRLTNTNRCWI